MLTVVLRRTGEARAPNFLPLDAKPGALERWLRSDVHPLDARVPWTLTTPGDHPLDRLVRAVEHRLEPAVGRVANPPGDREPGGLLGARRPEEDTLHQAADRHAHRAHAAIVPGRWSTRPALR